MNMQIVRSNQPECTISILPKYLSFMPQATSSSCCPTSPILVVTRHLKSAILKTFLVSCPMNHVRFVNSRRILRTRGMDVVVVRAVHSVNRNRIFFRLTETEIMEKSLPKTEPKNIRF